MNEAWRRNREIARHAVVETEELGELTLVAAGPALAGIYYPGHWTRPDRAAFGPRVDAGADPVLAEAAGQLHEYLAGDRTSFDLRTATRGGRIRGAGLVAAAGDPVRRDDDLRRAGRAARRRAQTLARRVGQAVGSNPLSIVVPCHRVVGKNGELRGYAGGLERKRFLLDLEGAGQLSLGLRGRRDPAAVAGA